jgi:hypothetical protein
MHTKLIALFASLALFAPACGATSEPAQEGGGPVDVRVRQVLDPSKGLYIEGSYSYVRVERPDGEEVLKERLEGERILLRLVPGEYRLISFQRPCDANCGFLDPPTDRCEGLIMVRRAAEPLNVVVTVSPGEGCTIETE